MIVAKSCRLTADRCIVLGPFGEGDHWDTVGVLYGDSQGCYFRFGVGSEPSVAAGNFVTNVLALDAVLDAATPGLPMVSNGIAGLPYGFLPIPVGHVFDKRRPYAVVWIHPVAAAADAGVCLGVRPGPGSVHAYHGKGSNIPVGRQYG